MGVSNVPAASAAGLQPKYQKFTSSGTFTLPTGYGVSKPLLVNIQVIGGGGGGSAYQANIVDGVNQTIGSYNTYFGNGETHTVNHTHNFATTTVNANAGAGGGSGGLAASQLYLTSNLSITVGAAGARPTVDTATLTNSGVLNFQSLQTATGTFTMNHTVSANILTAGGSGGISTAGSISATGGTGATSGTVSGTLTVAFTKNNGGINNETTNATNAVSYNSGAIATTNTGGAAGQPAGSAGMATPLLGALAGGAASTTPVYGAYGVGGKSTDGATHSGVEGTGGGWGSIGASGAVILTWWE